MGCLLLIALFLGSMWFLRSYIVNKDEIQDNTDERTASANTDAEVVAGLATTALFLYTTGDLKFKQCKDGRTSVKLFGNMFPDNSIDFKLPF